MLNILRAPRRMGEYSSGKPSWNKDVIIIIIVIVIEKSNIIGTVS